jgi:hypothetical protein
MKAVPYTYSHKAAAKWAAFNSIFWVLTLLAFGADMKGAENALTFVTVFCAIFAMTGWVAHWFFNARLGWQTSEVPLWVELVHDVFFTLLYAWCGAWLLTIAMLAVAIDTQLMYREFEE